MTPKNIINHFFMLLFFLASCRGTHSDNPIIDKEKFIAILIDIHLTEASLMQSNPFEKGRTVSMIMQYDKIFEKHQVSREDFMQTFDYYRQHPKEMDELYNEITERMTIKEAEISKQSLQEQKQP